MADEGLPHEDLSEDVQSKMAPEMKDAFDEMDKLVGDLFALFGKISGQYSRLKKDHEDLLKQRAN